MEGDPRQGDDDHVLGNGVDDENEAMEEEGMDQLRTVSTNSVSGSGAGRQDRTTTTGRRRLRFQDNHHVVAYLPLPSEIEDSQRRDMWWGAQDYENFSIMARNIARETRRHRSLSIGLDEAYKKAAKASRIVDESTIELAVEKLTGNSVSLSYQLTQQLFRSCENVPLTTVCFPPKKGLHGWCTHGHSRRGLERWISRLHSACRSDDASTAKSRVVHLQDMDSEELRQESLARSRTARLFARLMGEADRAAVGTYSGSASAAAAVIQSRATAQQLHQLQQQFRRNVAIATTPTSSSSSSAAASMPGGYSRRGLQGSSLPNPPSGLVRTRI